MYFGGWVRLGKLSRLRAEDGELCSSVLLPFRCPPSHQDTLASTFTGAVDRWALFFVSNYQRECVAVCVEDGFFCQHPDARNWCSHLVSISEQPGRAVG